MFFIPKYQKEHDVKLVSHLLLPGQNNVRMLFSGEAKRKSDAKEGINFLAIDENDKTEVKNCFDSALYKKYKIRTGSYVKLRENVYVVAAQEKSNTYILKIKVGD